MKLEEIEPWFEAEKDRVEKAYLERIKNEVPEGPSRAQFDEDMKVTLAKYTAESRAKIKPEGAKKAQVKWNKVVTDRIYNFMNKLTGQFRER